MEHNQVLWSLILVEGKVVGGAYQRLEPGSAMSMV